MSSCSPITVAHTSILVPLVGSSAVERRVGNTVGLCANPVGPPVGNTVGLPPYYEYDKNVDATDEDDLRRVT